MYAFWTHAIDLIIQQVERKYHESDEERLNRLLKNAYNGRSELNVPNDYFDDEDCAFYDDYVDTAHVELLRQVQSLPEDTRIPVQRYMRQRIERVPEESYESLVKDLESFCN